MREWRPAMPDPKVSLFRFPELSGNAGWDLCDEVLIAFDIETTGLDGDEDRIVEIGIVRLDRAGTVLDEWTSLVDPGCDVGPTFVHHITNEMVAGAPTVGDLVPEIVPRLEGGVVVSHHAAFEEKFLRNELRRVGIVLPPMPAACTLHMALEAFDIENHRLTTCCDHIGIGELHTGGALGDARVKARLAHHLVHERGIRSRWDIPLPSLPRYPAQARARVRVTGLRKGDAGWMAGVIAKLPMATGVDDPPAADTYLEALSVVLADGKLTGEEAKALSKLAGRAGFGAAELESLHLRFLDGMAEAALEDRILEAGELKQLNRAAELLGVPGYFDELSGQVTPSNPAPAAKHRKQLDDVSKVWCSPSIDAATRDRLRAAGVNVVSNLSKYVTAMVVAEADEDDPRVLRGRAGGKRLVLSTSIPELMPMATTAISQFPPPDPAARRPPPWLISVSHEAAHRGA